MKDKSQIHGESNAPLYLAISIMFNIAMFAIFVMPVILKGGGVMIKFIVIFLLKCLFLPFSACCLIGTAAIELCTDEDWAFWQSHNQSMIKMLPWKFK